MIAKNIKRVINKKNYFIIFLLVSIISFIVLYLLTLATVTDYSLIIFVIMNGFWYTVLTFLIFILISLLFGLYIALIVYKFKTLRKTSLKSNTTGFIGLVSGIFGAGCPMCGSLIFGFFGAPLALFFMPFKGLELRFLSLILLSISVFIISKNLDNKC